MDSTFTLALLTAMNVRTVGAKVVANLGGDKVKATVRFLPVTRSIQNPPCFRSASQKAGRIKES